MPRGSIRVRNDSPHGAAAKRKMTNKNLIGYPDDATNNNCLVWENVVVSMETDEAEDPTNGEPPDITDNNSSNNDNNLMTSSANTTSVATCQAWVSRRPMAFM